MAINFCDPVLKPVFSCNEPSHDGYPISNLGSSSDRRKGFIGYGSPPITVKVEFLCSVNIERIVIHPQVLSQKSLGFEISVRCSTKKKQTWQSYSSTSEPPAFHFEGHDDSFHRIGSIILDRIDKGAIFSKHGSSTETLPNYTTRSMFQHYAVQNADSMQIKIFKTAASSPALGGLEVWGKPSSSCPRKMRQDIFLAWNDRNVGLVGLGVQKPNRPVASTNRSTETTSKSESKFDSHIPEEFLDSLTFDIMSLPFILPSGKIVDFQTLEKHKNFEEMYGRAPSDPFTGKLFTHGCCPVPDNDLKRRINHFLLENSNKEEFANVPRTTGTRTRSIFENKIQINKSFPSSAISQSFSLNTGHGTLVSHSLLPVDIAPTSTNFIINGCKRKVETIVGLECENDKVKRIKRSMMTTDSCKLSSDRTVSFSSNISHIKEGDCPKTHDELVEDSLESALKSVLSGRPTFVNFHASQSPPLKANCCVDCKSTETLYRLPCTHLICRSCLLLKKSSNQQLGLVLICVECSTPYESANAARFHNQ